MVAKKYPRYKLPGKIRLKKERRKNYLVSEIEIGFDHARHCLAVEEVSGHCNEACVYVQC